MHSIFWVSAVAFFLVQATMLGHLVLGGRFRRDPQGTRSVRERHLEIVWTLVPASVLVALVLMMYGLTDGAWSRTRTPVDLRLMLVPQATALPR